MRRRGKAEPCACSGKTKSGLNGQGSEPYVFHTDTFDLYEGTLHHNCLDKSIYPEGVLRKWYVVYLCRSRQPGRVSTILSHRSALGITWTGAAIQHPADRPPASFHSDSGTRERIEYGGRSGPRPAPKVVEHSSPFCSPSVHAKQDKRTLWRLLPSVYSCTRFGGLGKRGCY